MRCAKSQIRVINIDADWRCLIGRIVIAEPDAAQGEIGLRAAGGVVDLKVGNDRRQ
jgi:hypothetical protein